VHNFYNQSAPTPDSANPIQQPQTIIEIRHIEAAGSALKRPAWSGPFEPGRSSGVYGGQKLALKPSHADCAIQISAQQPRIEIDVLNLRSAGDLTILSFLGFHRNTPKFGGQHKEFFSDCDDDGRLYRIDCLRIHCVIRASWI
jgi:hypothetical protein